MAARRATTTNAMAIIRRTKSFIAILQRHKMDAVRHALDGGMAINSIAQPCPSNTVRKGPPRSPRPRRALLSSTRSLKRLKLDRPSGDLGTFQCAAPTTVARAIGGDWFLLIRSHNLRGVLEDNCPSSFVPVCTKCGSRFLPKLFRGLDDLSISAEGAGLTQPEESIARQALDLLQALQVRVVFQHLSRPILSSTIFSARAMRKDAP